MYKVVRKIHTHLNIIDSVYKDDKLQFEQPNLNSKNRFNCNNFITPEGFGLHYGLDYDTYMNIIDKGRELNNNLN